MGGYYKLDELREIEDPGARYRAAMDAFEARDARLQIGRDVAKALKESGHATTHVAANIGVDKGILSKYLTGKRPFGLSGDGLIKMGTMYLHKSAHQIMFGETAATLLPRHLEMVAKAMKSADSETREKVSAIAGDALRLEQIERKAPERQCSEVIGMRLKEIAADMYLNPLRIFGDDADADLKVALKRYVNPSSAVIGYLSTFMLYALELNTTLDYFIAEDYSAYTPIGYQNGKVTTVVSDRKTQSFVSSYLRLSDQGQNEVLAQVYGVLFPI